MGNATGGLSSFVYNGAAAGSTQSFNGVTLAASRANITAVIWDPFWKAGTWEVPDPRFYPSLRINSSLIAFHPGASDFENSNLIRDWASHFDVDVGSLQDLEELMDRVLVFREHNLFCEIERTRLSRRALVSAFFGAKEEARGGPVAN